MDSPSPVRSAAADDSLRVIVRPLPKVVFFYPVWVASLLCGLLFGGEPSANVGLAWMAVFFFNLLVISFDFNEERSLILGLGAVLAVFAALFFGVLGSVSSWFLSLQPRMNSTFYLMVFTGFSVVFFFVWLRTRFDYWEFRPNEVVHRSGVFPRMKRYSTEDMRWDKTVPDLLERLLLRSGSIILTTPHEKQPVVLEHVPGIGKLDDRIADILGVKSVVHRESRPSS